LSAVLKARTLGGMDLLLEVEDDGDPGAEIASLQRFLRTDDQLRSVDVEARTGSAGQGAMSPITDALMLAFGPGGVGVAVVEAVTAWLKSRRSNVKVKISTGGRTVELDVQSTKDPAIIATLLAAVQGSDTGAASATP
jgi:hypothetical protein